MLVYYLVAVCCVLLLAAWLVVQNTRWAVLVVLTMLSLVLGAFPWSVVGVRGAATGMLCGVSGLAIIFGLADRKRQKVKMFSIGYVRWIAFFSVLLAICVTYSGNREYGGQKALFFAVKSVFPLLGFAALAPFSRKDQRIILVALFVGSILTSLNLVSFGDLDSARAVSLDQRNPITLGREICVGGVAGLLWAVFALRSESVFSRSSTLYFCLILGSLILFYVATFTGSRGPLGIAILVVMLVSGLSLFSGAKRLAAVVSVLVVGLIAYGAVRQIDSDNPNSAGLKRILNYIEGGEMIANDEVRIAGLNRALGVALLNPFVGAGSGGYSESGRQYPHNVIAEISAELGLVGLVFVGVLLWLPLISLNGARKRVGAGPELYAVAGIWIFSAGNAMISGDIASNYLIWIAGGLCVMFSSSTQQLAKSRVARQRPNRRRRF